MSKTAGEGCEILVPFNERKPLDEIERSLIKKYRKKIWTKFIKAVKDYKLVEEGDKIAVAISGGKDSMLMAKLFQELKKHGQVNFELEFIAMDPGYHENIKELLNVMSDQETYPNLATFLEHVSLVIDNEYNDNAKHFYQKNN